MDERRYTYFISDLHLGAKYITDARAHEARVTRFLETIAPTARRLFLLGDVLDYWFEYNSVVPRGHVRLFGALAALADAGVEITWLTGNHDVWLRDYLRDEIGMTVLTVRTVVDLDGHRFMLSHGDDIGKQPVMYRFMKWCFLNPVCQWLYAALHPNFTHWIATSWSSHNRTSRVARVGDTDPVKMIARLDGAIDALSAEHPDIEYFVTGHLHVASITRAATTGATIVHLGDWITQDTYARWDGITISLHHFPE